jgi:hypothetical protein
MLPEQQGEYLDQMAKSGLWGDDRDEVARQLIATGIQRGFEIGVVTLVNAEDITKPVVDDDEIGF